MLDYYLKRGIDPKSVSMIKVANKDYFDASGQEYSYKTLEPIYGKEMATHMLFEGIPDAKNFKHQAFRYSPYECPIKP